jgi:hypothetical protein
MKKEDYNNEEINPNGISITIVDLDENVWERGYYCETEDGTWYEVYVNLEIKKYYPEIDLNNEDHNETFSGFNDLYLGNYVDYNQITFFVPIGEDEFNLENLTEILC